VLAKVCQVSVQGECDGDGQRRRDGLEPVVGQYGLVTRPKGKQESADRGAPYGQNVNLSQFHFHSRKIFTKTNVN
jgi:hypothetical protein